MSALKYVPLLRTQLSATIEQEATPHIVVKMRVPNTNKIRVFCTSNWCDYEETLNENDAEVNATGHESLNDH